ncbi:MAG: GNAT family N-acetyltransferase [bacterium]
MLHRAEGLSADHLRAIAELERQVVAADGGRLKLEWGSLRSRPAGEVNDLLWWDGTELVGFLGRYAFGVPAELAGMVRPATRGRGIGTALLDAGLALAGEHGDGHVLVVVPRRSAAGARLAVRHGGRLDHSEHALVLEDEPVDGPSDPAAGIRPAGPADIHAVSRLLEIGFGHPAGDVAGALSPADEPTLVVEHDGTVVGTLRLTRDGAQAGIYGFVIDEGWRGRGIGRDVLRRVCRQARAGGAERVGLEVEVDNDRALGLYTSLGFRPMTTEDYYAFDLG